MYTVLHVYVRVLCLGVRVRVSARGSVVFACIIICGLLHVVMVITYHPRRRRAQATRSVKVHLQTKVAV